MSKEKYCEFCGRELEHGKCYCKAYAKTSEKPNTKNKTNVSKENEFDTENFLVCDACGKNVHVSATYCPYCGLPVHIDGKIPSLHKELQGDKAEDVIEVYSRNDSPRHRMKKEIELSLSSVIIIAIITLILGIFIGAYAHPKINTLFKEFLLRQALTEESVLETTTQKVIEEIETENKDSSEEEEEEGETNTTREIIETTIIEPTAGTKKNKKENLTNTTSQPETSESIILETATFPVIEENARFYKEPNAEAEEVVQNTTTSESSLEITGIDKDKKYELYIRTGIRARKDIGNGHNSCNLITYLPVIDGLDQKEVSYLNNILTVAFYGEYYDMIENYINARSEFPKSVILNKIKQVQSNEKVLRFQIHGKVKPNSGLSIKLSYRFIYDRKNKTLTVEELPGE